MKIVVFSDSHGSLTEMHRVLTTEKNIDLVLHAGDFGYDLDNVIRLMDSKLKYMRVKGNCDYNSDAPDDLLFEAEGLKILVHHGKGLGVKASLNKLDYYARERGADIVIYGHSHLPLLKNMGDLMIMNPGSIGWPKGAGRTYGVIDIDKNRRPKIKADIIRYVPNKDDEIEKEPW